MRSCAWIGGRGGEEDRGTKRRRGKIGFAGADREEARAQEGATEEGGSRAGRDEEAISWAGEEAARAGDRQAGRRASRVRACAEASCPLPCAKALSGAALSRADRAGRRLRCRNRYRSGCDRSRGSSSRGHPALSSRRDELLRTDRARRTRWRRDRARGGGQRGLALADAPGTRRRRRLHRHRRPLNANRAQSWETPRPIFSELLRTYCFLMCLSFD
jgi:hypothetical protein